MKKPHLLTLLRWFSLAVALLCLTVRARPQETATNTQRMTYTGSNVIVLSATNGTGTNWGAVCAGFRMGISFEKDSFTNGEPIMGAVTLQNVTGVYQNANLNAPALQEIVVLNSHGEELQMRPELRPKTPFEARLRKVMTNARYVEIAPGGAAKLTVRPDTQYDLSAPETYQVYFSLTLPATNTGPGKSQITSGKAVFRVLPQSKPTEASH